MGIETGTAIIIGSLLVGGTQGYFGERSLQANKEAKNQQKALEEERRVALANEAAARDAARKKAETTGQRVGLRSAFETSLGFGTPSITTGAGKGTLFGN